VFLFVLAAGVVAISVASILVLVGIALRAEVGQWHPLNLWGDDTRWFGFVLAALGLLVVSPLAVTGVGWRGCCDTTSSDEEEDGEGSDPNEQPRVVLRGDANRKKHD
jgi:hypothetical protein